MACYHVNSNTCYHDPACAEFTALTQRVAALEKWAADRPGADSYCVPFTVGTPADARLRALAEAARQEAERHPIPCEPGVASALGALWTYLRETAR